MRQRPDPTESSRGDATSSKSNFVRFPVICVGGTRISELPSVHNLIFLMRAATAIIDKLICRRKPQFTEYMTQLGDILEKSFHIYGVFLRNVRWRI